LAFASLCSISLIKTNTIKNIDKSVFFPFPVRELDAIICQDMSYLIGCNSDQVTQNAGRNHFGLAVMWFLIGKFCRSVYGNKQIELAFFDV